MSITTHQIAGITFRTEANLDLLGLEQEPFAGFRVPDGAVPDVRQRIHQVQLAEVRPGSLPAKLRERLEDRRMPVGANSLTSPLLDAPQVQAWLDVILARPGAITLSLENNRLVGRDFERRALDFFYLEEPDPVRVPSAPPMRAAGEPEPRFSICPLDLEPDAAPLAPEERTWLLQSVRFAPPEGVDAPVLRTSRLRAWLRDCLAQGDRIDVQLYLDGLMVANQTQNSLDFFYCPEFGHAAERRAADYYRRMFASFLPLFSAQLVHSSGIIRAGRAALFLAQDEGGKTTLLRSAPGGQALNDDQVIVKRAGSQFDAHATPLGRLTGGPAQARLGGLFVLQKANHFALEPFPPAHLVSILSDEHRIHTALLPRELKRRAFDFFYDLCHAVPVYRMQFAKDRVDWAAIDAVLQETL